MASFKQQPNKSLKCKDCGELVKNVGHDATSVTCHHCVSKSLGSTSVLWQETDTEIKTEEKN